MLWATAYAVREVGKAREVWLRTNWGDVDAAEMVQRAWGKGGDRTAIAVDGMECVVLCFRDWIDVH